MAVIKMNLQSRALHIHTNVNIILPINTNNDRDHRFYKNYGPDVKYPTLWLLHGGGGDADDFILFSNIVRYAELHGLAVVMPSGYNVFYKDPYYEFVTEELPAVLQNTMSLSSAREDNFIGGLSIGGDAALRACLEHPDRYAAGLIMSAAGTDHHGDDPDLRFDVYGLAEKALASGGAVPELIFATGSGDRGMPYYLPIIDKLDAMGMPVKRHYVENEGHSWDFWDNTVKMAIETMLPIKCEMVAE